MRRGGLGPGGAWMVLPDAVEGMSAGDDQPVGGIGAVRRRYGRGWLGFPRARCSSSKAARRPRRGRGQRVPPRLRDGMPRRGSRRRRVPRQTRQCCRVAARGRRAGTKSRATSSRRRFAGRIRSSGFTICCIAGRAALRARNAEQAKRRFLRSWRRCAWPRPSLIAAQLSARRAVKGPSKNPSGEEMAAGAILDLDDPEIGIAFDLTGDIGFGGLLIDGLGAGGAEPGEFAFEACGFERARRSLARAD